MTNRSLEIYMQRRFQRLEQMTDEAYAKVIGLILNEAWRPKCDLERYHAEQTREAQAPTDPRKQPCP